MRRRRSVERSGLNHPPPKLGTLLERALGRRPGVRAGRDLQQDARGEVESEPRKLPRGCTKVVERACWMANGCPRVETAALEPSAPKAAAQIPRSTKNSNRSTAVDDGESEIRAEVHRARNDRETRRLRFEDAVRAKRGSRLLKNSPTPEEIPAAVVRVAVRPRRRGRDSSLVEDGAQCHL